MRTIGLGLTVFIILLNLCLSTLGFSEQLAVTKDGKQVVLRDNGSWEYAKEETTRADTPDFRQTQWGMTKPQVRAAEKGEILTERDDVIGYQGSIAGLECFIFYVFAEGKLVRTKYVITTSHSNQNDYIADYINLEQNLSQKYGKPTKDASYWLNDLYKDEFQQRGFAISLGHLAYSASFEKERTSITLYLHGENYKINLGIEYRSKMLRELEEKKEQQKARDEF